MLFFVEEARLSFSESSRPSWPGLAHAVSSSACPDSSKPDQRIIEHHETEISE
jgi:hypothetical protein